MYKRQGTYRCEITDFSVIGDMLADGTVDSVDAVLTVTYLETTNGAATVSYTQDVYKRQSGGYAYYEEGW